jgi:small subunit ribosomal protein S6
LSFAGRSGNVRRFEGATYSEEVSVLYPYETLLIFDPRLNEEEVTALLTKLQETLGSLGGEVVKGESWGKRRLAYDIRKQREGTYAVLESRAEPVVVKEFERQLKLNEQVLRYFTTRVPVPKRIRSAPKPSTPTVEEVV